MNKRSIIFSIISLSIIGFAFYVVPAVAGKKAIEDNNGEVSYHLAWVNSAQGEIMRDGTWVVINDLGYSIHVQKGYLTSYSAQLIECDDHTHVDEEAHTWLNDIIAPFAPQTAYAGHSGDKSPTLVDESIIEILVPLRTVEMGVATAPGINYCQLHYLIARANASTANLPNDADMLTATLYLEGTYQAPQSDENIPFVIQTNFNNGAIVDITTDAGEIAHISLGEKSTSVTIQREVSHIFDGVDFATMTEEAIGKAVLWGIIDGTYAIITEGHSH